MKGSSSPSRMRLAKVPAYLLTSEGAMRVTGSFWDTHRLNPLAGADDIDAITRVVNEAAMAAVDERRTLTATARKLIS